MYFCLLFIITYIFTFFFNVVYIDEDVRKNYKVEDFLWSGSGDGENEIETVPATDEQTSWEHTTTVFHTTTIITTSTVFYSVVSTIIPVSRIEMLSKNKTKSNNKYVIPKPLF